MGLIKTVKIRDGADYRVIRASDFDPEAMELFERPSRRRAIP